MNELIFGAMALLVAVSSLAHTKEEEKQSALRPVCDKCDKKN